MEASKRCLFVILARFVLPTCLEALGFLSPSVRHMTTRPLPVKGVEQPLHTTRGSR